MCPERGKCGTVEYETLALALGVLSLQSPQVLEALEVRPQLCIFPEDTTLRHHLIIHQQQYRNSFILHNSKPFDCSLQHNNHASPWTTWLCKHRFQHSAQQLARHLQPTPRRENRTPSSSTFLPSGLSHARHSRAAGPEGATGGANPPTTPPNPPPVAGKFNGNDDATGCGGGGTIDDVTTADIPTDAGSIWLLPHTTLSTLLITASPSTQLDFGFGHVRGGL
jgi:hypothetical protein